MRNKKRRYSEKKKSDMTTVFISIISLISILIFLFSLIYTTNKKGSINKIFPAIGMILLILSVEGVILSIREQKKDNYNLLSRRIGLISSILSLIIWLTVLIIGLL